MRGTKISASSIENKNHNASTEWSQRKQTVFLVGFAIVYGTLIFIDKIPFLAPSM